MGLTQILGTQIKDNDLTFDDIADGAVRGSTANGGVQRELATGTVSDVDIRNSAITPLKIDSTQSFSMAAITLSNTSNQLILGTTNTVTITSPAPAASRVLTIPDVGGSASFIMSEGTQSVNGTKTFTSTLTTATNVGLQLNSGGGGTAYVDFYGPASGQYRMALSGSDINFTVVANTTLSVRGASLVVSPNSSPSWTFNNGGLTSSTGLFYTGNGTVGGPAHSFSGDSDTGMYDVSANVLGFATGGIEAIRITSGQDIGIGGAPITNGILTINSTAKAFVPPRMSTTQRDNITPLTAGMTIYNNVTNELNVYNGTTWIPVGSTAFPLHAPDGTAALPSYSFTNNNDMGMYRVGANVLSFATSGLSAIQIDASGNVDFLQHQAKQMVVHILSSDPGSPVEGQIWYNTTTKQWAGYNGTTNVVLG